MTNTIIQLKTQYSNAQNLHRYHKGLAYKHQQEMQNLLDAINLLEFKQNQRDN